MAQDSDKEFEEKMNRMIFDYLNERKMDKIAKKFSKECGTDMDKKFKRPNLKKEWLNFLKQAEERYVYFDDFIVNIVSHEVERCYPDLRPIFYIFSSFYSVLTLDMIVLVIQAPKKIPMIRLQNLL